MNKPNEVYNTSVDNKDSIFRDSIIIENSRIDTFIKEINHYYDKEVDSIISLPDSSAYSFFSRYIENYNKQRATNNY